MSMAKVRTPRSAWIDAAQKALAVGGPEAVKVETLAAGLGVSKGGFYWHFKDRQALINEALDAWEESGTDEVIDRIESQEDDPREKVRHLFGMAPGADEFFATELALRDWARRDRAVAARMDRVDTRRMEFLRSMFIEFSADEDDAEARSMLAYSLMVGSYFVNGQYGDRSRAEVLQLSIDWLVRD
jgi:AcrR family transcriptional regulator